MFNSLLFLFLSVFMLINQYVTVNAARLKCEFNINCDYVGIDEGESGYCCDVIDNEIFTGERLTIDSTEGEHRSGKTMADVKGINFQIISSVNYMPQNLEIIFDDLKAIVIDACNLKEIKQSDIKVFPSLQYLNLFDNEITTIDADLFEFNPELRTIYLYYNQISHIDPNVFNHLSHLNTLRLSNNQCKNALSSAITSRSKVLEIIERVRNGDCVSSVEMERKKQEKELIVVEEKLEPNYANKNSFMLIFAVLSLSVLISMLI